MGGIDCHSVSEFIYITAIHTLIYTYIFHEGSVDNISLFLFLFLTNLKGFDPINLEALSICRKTCLLVHINDIHNINFHKHPLKCAMAKAWQRGNVRKIEYEHSLSV